MKRYNRLLALVLAFTLTVSVTLSGCKDKEEASSQPEPPQSSSSQSSQSSDAAQMSSVQPPVSSSSEAAGPVPGPAESVSSESAPQPSQTVAQTPVCSKPGYYTAQETLVSLQVTTGGVLLQNKSTLGDLEITAAAENQPITLSDVTVGGNLIIRGGGIVTLNNVSAPILYAQKAEDPICLLLQGDVDIPQAMLGGETIILDGGITSGGLQNVFLDQVDSDAEAGFSVLELQGVRIDQLVVDQGSEVMLYEGAAVGDAWANAPVSFRGTGKINVLNCTSAGVSYQTVPGQIKLQEGIVPPTLEAAASSSVVRIPIET